MEIEEEEEEEVDEEETTKKQGKAKRNGKKTNWDFEEEEEEYSAGRNKKKATKATKRKPRTNNSRSKKHQGSDDDDHSDNEEDGEEEQEKASDNRKKPTKANRTTTNKTNKNKLPPSLLNLDLGPPRPAGARLIIHKLELENFKSYAGVRVVGPFHKCFTSVVGPNGSGKSNVIDALLFVFGKRAKQLRQAKVSDLIHCSEQYPNLQTARVSVHFCDIVDKKSDHQAEEQGREGRGEDFTVVPGSQLVLTREATKSNSSKYYINGKASNYTEVTALLRHRGIDLDHNRFLILQGEVEQIALMKPRGQNKNDVGMLEYLEDLIGSNEFVEAIEESGKLVESLSEERNEQVARVRIVEKERDGLEAAKNEAMEYIYKEKEIMEKQSILYQLGRAEAQAKVTAAAKKKAEIESKWKEEQERMATMRKELGEKEAGFKKEKKEYSALEKAMQTAKSDFTVYERNDVQMRQDMKHLSGKKKTLAQTLAKETNKLEEKRQQIAELERTIPGSARRLEELRGQLIVEEEKLSRIYEGLKGETSGLHHQMEEKQKQLMPSQKKINAARAEIELCLSKKAIIEERLAGVEQRFAQDKEAQAAIDQKLLDTKQAAKERQKELAQAKQQKEELSAQLKSCIEEEAQLADRVRALQLLIQQSEEAQSNVQMQSKLMRRLLEAGREGTLQGVHNRLGDLGSIHAKYDVAVSTACPALDHIVVDSTEDAQRCVELLRAEDLGRATFIILDKLQYLEKKAKRTEANGGTGFPEGVPRLFDLIQPLDPRYDLAFYQALQDTLVANDVEQATRIAYSSSGGSNKRYRVVTLKGELIDLSGTMSGGGSNPLSGKMKTSSSSSSRTAACSADPSLLSKKELHLKQKELQQCTEQLASLRKQRQELSQQLESNEALLNSLPLDLKKMKMEYQALQSQKEEVQQRLASLQQQSKLSAKEESSLAALQEEVDEKEAAIAEIKNQAAQLEEEVAAIQEEINRAGGKPLRQQKATVQQLNEEIDRLAAALTKDEVQLSSAKKLVRKVENTIEKTQREMQEAEEKFQETKERAKGLEEDAERVLQDFEAAKQALAAKEEKMRHIQRQYDEIKERVAGMRSREVEVENQLADASKNLQQHQKKVQMWTQRLHEVMLKYSRLCSEHELPGQTEGQEQEKQKEKEKEKEKEGTEEEEEEEEEMEKEQETEANEGDAMDEEEEGDEEETEGSSSNRKAKKKQIPSASASSLPMLSTSELERCDPQQLECDIGLLQEELSKMKPNVTAITQYNEKQAEYLRRAALLEEITCKRDTQRQRWDQLRKSRLDMFMEGFSQITMKLKEMYQMITIGGDAELELVDSLDPFSEGVVFSVRPPKKSWKNIINLSGGEKTLSSLSLVFALHHYKPTPIYIMDEIDAALDFRNVSIIANYIKDRTKDAQFLIVSLRNNMFEMADRMVGIYKTNNCTKSITINPHQFVLPTNTSSLASTTSKQKKKGLRQTAVAEEEEEEGQENVDPNASLSTSF
ncbi:Structural maintenance of chromosomes protein 4 [Balamuthia mandrillaris]